jgi:hypothetical protein
MKYNFKYAVQCDDGKVYVILAIHEKLKTTQVILHNPQYNNKNINSVLDNMIYICNIIKSLHTIKNNTYGIIPSWYIEECHFQVKDVTTDYRIFQEQE